MGAGCRAVLAARVRLARWRLRIEWICTFRAGKEEESPSGDSGCPAQAADKRTLRPGPLVNHPAPKEREERLPLLWKPPLPPQVQPHVWIESVVQWGITLLPFRITGRFTNSGNRNRLRYAQRRRCSGACQTFQLRRGKGCSGKMLDLDQTARCAPIATTES